MSHEDLALLWSILYGREDIDSILLEAIGRHSLDVSIYRTNQLQLRKATTHHALTLKVIFDLQRTYLQSSSPSAESKASQLQHELLFSSVLHLLDVTTVAYSIDGGPSAHAAQVSLFAQIILSALRALHLQRRALAQHEHRVLTQRFDDLFQNRRLSPADGFTVHIVCRKIIEEISPGAQSKETALPACGAAQLPDFFNKLYPVEALSSETIEAVHRAVLASTSSPDWLRQFLTLYDILWNSAAASVQLCMISKKRRKSQQWSLADEVVRLNDLQSILTARFQLQYQLYNTPTRLSFSEDERGRNQQMKVLLGSGLPPACMQDQCKCLSDDGAAVENLRSRYHGKEVLSQMSRFISTSQHTDGEALALEELSLSLLLRAQKSGKKRLEIRSGPHTPVIPVSSLKVQTTPAQLVQEAQERTSPATIRHPSNLRTPGGHRETMIEDMDVSTNNITLAPEARMAEPHGAEEKICSEEKKDQSPLNEWQPPHVDFNMMLDLKAPNLVSVSRATPMAPSYDEVVINDRTERTTDSSARSPPLSSVGTSPLPWARQIDSGNYPELSPAHIKHEGMPQSRRTNDSQADNFPEVAQTSLHRGPAASIMSDDSEPSRFVQDTSSSKSKKWGSIFKSKGNVPAMPIPAAAFSASGKSLLMWNEIGAGYYDLHNAESIQFQKFNASSVRIAAGGTAQFAVVSKTGSEYTLEIFSSGFDIAIRDWRLESLPSAMAFARNDQYVALKFSRYVSIYDTTTGGSFYHELPYQNSRSGRGNHLVAFSSDSLSFVASTRYEPEKVITYWSECTIATKAKVVESSAPFGLVGDDGLSSLVCSSTSTRSAYLTTFTEKGHPTLLSFSPKPTSRLLRDNVGQIGARINRAALCSAGTNLVLLNQRNDVFWVRDCFGNQAEARRVGSIKRPTSVKRDAEIGMPNSDEVHVFWIEKGRGNLVTMGRGGGKAKPVELIIDMEALVA